MKLRLLLSLCGLMSVFSISTAAAQEKITIEYWNINTSTFGGPQVDALIASFEAKNPNINVESRPKDRYDTLVQDTQTAIAGGNPPDIVQIGWPYLRYTSATLPYISIESLVEKYGGAEAFADIPKNIFDLTLVNGEHVGLAYSLSNAVVYYNPELFRKAGLDPDNPPRTIQEWTEAAAVFKKALNLPLIAIDYSGDNWAIENLIASNGGNLLICEADGTFAAGVSSPEAVEALQTWADWVAKGYAVNALDQARTVFWTGQAGALFWSIAGRGAITSNKTFDELRATTYPQFGDKPTRLPTGGNMLVFFATEPARQEAAWRFALHLVSPEGITEWTKGTGYIPLIPKLAEDPKYLASFYAENPIQRVATRQIENMIVWTSFPGENGLAAGAALFRAVQAALGGQLTAEAALSAAAKEINDLIGNEPCSGTSR
ncbi:ABC transporter substrate-binding protein [Synechococcus sp. H60.4]|uniref:ABC transporter substrate-binding protein n=1 Tax=Synechococcus sp. H60.4 TaxID=2964519 RepID=UPI0039C0C542